MSHFSPLCPPHTDSVIIMSKQDSSCASPLRLCCAWKKQKRREEETNGDTPPPPLDLHSMAVLVIQMLIQEQEWREGCEAQWQCSHLTIDDLLPHCIPQPSALLCVHSAPTWTVVTDISMHSPALRSMVATKKPGYFPHFQDSIKPKKTINLR